MEPSVIPAHQLPQLEPSSDKKVAPLASAGSNQLELLVDGMRCASCAWRIENTLNAEAGVKARLNFSTRRLSLSWQGEAARSDALLAKIEELGFKAVPFSAKGGDDADMAERQLLRRAMAVSGFASGFIMLFALMLWLTTGAGMGQATHTLMHWVSALIALPAVAYAGLPFFRSALTALRHGRTNMDVPISIAVILACGMSLFETIRDGPYVYFDAAVMLLFFLLVGRYLDKQVRGRARAVAHDLLAMLEGSATVLENGTIRQVPIRELQPGMVLSVAMGEKVAVDGEVITGISEVDTGLLTGETMPQPIGPGARVFGGTINLAMPLTVRVSAASEQSLLADIVRLMEKAEQGQAKYVRLADKAATLYTPVVHLLALTAFVGWLIAGVEWQVALMVATTVLIITCPCALGLAVPAVQVVATGRLFKAGMLVKSGDALERLATIDTVIFDKTGTLTTGQPSLTNKADIPADTLALAAAIARHSKHPLAIALSTYAKAAEELVGQVIEVPGAGLEYGPMRLGKREWCEVTNAPSDNQMELWLTRPDFPPQRFTFADALRPDAVAVIHTFKNAGIAVEMLSGDRAEVAAQVASTLGIAHYKARMSPVDKASYLNHLIGQGKKVLMVGDGLNDAPALRAATASMSPASAADITQNAADIVFQGQNLASVVTAWQVARASARLVRQNFALSWLYNALAIPLAMVGWVTPLLAAAAMSGSSLVVVLNALRLKQLKA